MIRISTAASLLAATLSGALSMAASAAPFEPIALSGQTAPGVPSATYRQAVPVIAANGDVAFRGVVEGSGINDSNDVGIWVYRNGQVELLAREGDQAAGYAATVRYNRVDEPSIADDGEVYYTGRALGQGPFVSAFALWRGTPGNVAILSAEGQPTPGATPSVPMYRPVGLPLLAGDNVAFYESVGPPAQRIWSGPATAINQVLQANIPAPGIGGGVLIETLEPVFGFSRITANAQGSVALNVELTGPGVVIGNNDVAAYLLQQGGPALLARTGDQAPGVELGSVYSRLDNPVLNSSNQVAFRADLRGTPTPTQDFSGIWTGVPGSLTLAARSGSPAPGAPGRNFYTLHEPVLNDAGTLAFFATLADVGGANSFQYGLWTGSPGNLEMVVGPGTALPGTPPGLEFFDFHFANIDLENGPLMNARGDIVFHARLAPPGPGPGLSGVWAHVDGALQKIIMEGDTIDVNPDPAVTEFRQVASAFKIGGTGGSDGRRSSLNDNRQLVLDLLFTDGSSGIFRTTLVPEPGAITILAIAALAFAAASRSK